MATNVTFPYQQFTNIGGTAIAGTAEVTLQVAPRQTAGGVDNARQCNVLLAVRVLRATGASGTNIQPRIYAVSGASAGTVSEKWRAAAATAPATLVNTYAINDPMYCTTSGLLYFKIDGDANDTFFYEIIFQAGS